MSYAIFRVEPINKIADLAQIDSHNKREKKAYKSNPDIDITKTKNNIEIVPLSEKYIKGYYEKTSLKSSLLIMAGHTSSSNIVSSSLILFRC